MLDKPNTVPSALLPLSESWIYQVSVLADRIARRVAPIAAEIGGLNLSQWRVIAALADQPGRTASQVVELTPMDKGIVSRSVAEMVRRELIERRASDRDRRVHHLFLTEKGQATFDAIAEALRLDGADGGQSGSAKDRAALQSKVIAMIEAYSESQS